MSLILKTDKHFGDQLRVIRKQKNLSQIDVSLKMGCTSDNICHFEKGDNTHGEGSIKTVFKYARALGFKKVTFEL